VVRLAQNHRAQADHGVESPGLGALLSGDRDFKCARDPIDVNLVGVGPVLLKVVDAAVEQLARHEIVELAHHHGKAQTAGGPVFGVRIRRAVVDSWHTELLAA